MVQNNLKIDADVNSQIACLFTIFFGVRERNRKKIESQNSSNVPVHRFFFWDWTKIKREMWMCWSWWKRCFVSVYNISLCRISFPIYTANVTYNPLPLKMWLIRFNETFIEKQTKLNKGSLLWWKSCYGRSGADALASNCWIVGRRNILATICIQFRKEISWIYDDTAYSSASSMNNTSQMSDSEASLIRAIA